METLWLDVRHALAMMRRDGGFTAAALGTLALGIGATTAVFSVVYGVLLRPLPFPESERLVRLSEEHQGAISPLREPLLSNLTYYAWNQGPRTIDQFAAYSTQQFTVTTAEGSTRIDGAAVTPSLFTLVGAAPARGRLFRADEGPSGNDAFIVLSDRGWRERFNADPDIVDRSVVVDGRPFTVVGVARPGFFFPRPDTLMWTPMEVRRPSPDAVAGLRGQMSVLYALARLRPGVTPAQAEAEGTAAARTTIRPMAANLLFGVGGPPIVHVRGIVEEMTSTIRPALFVLTAAVVCVLLIACANVANLFLSRGVARQRELTVRAAIGASRGRLTRQLLTESLVLSAMGGAIGLGLARTLVGFAPFVAAKNLPRLDAVVVDARVMGFAAAAALVTALVSGLAPALRGARFNLAESLHGGDGATAGGFRGVRARHLRDWLLVAESAFAILLLVAATLLARSFVRLTRVDAGYTADNVLTGEINVPGYDAAIVLTPEGTARSEHISSLVRTILDRVRAMPSVESAAAANMMPLDRATQIAGFPAPWTPPGASPTSARALTYLVTPGYAETLRLRLRLGRFLTDSDRARQAGTRGWIVNEEFARLYLPEHPIGYQFEQRADTDVIHNEIVGVVANVLKNGNDAKPQPEVYFLPRGRQQFSGRFEVVVRTSGEPAALAAPLRAMVREVEPAAAIETVTLSRRVADSVDQPRFAMTVLAVFALLALTLASVGLHGVLSYGVSQRRRELGVRAALGASRSELMRLVLREGLAVTGVGLVIGLAGAAAMTRLMQRVLFGVAPLDPWSFTAAPVLLVLVATVACLLPAHRAASTEPAEALRCE